MDNFFERRVLDPRLKKIEFFDRQLNGGGGSNFFLRDYLLISRSIGRCSSPSPPSLLFCSLSSRSPIETRTFTPAWIFPLLFLLFSPLPPPPPLSVPSLPLDVPFHRRLIRRPRREEPTNCHEQCNARPIDDSFSSANLPNARSFPSFLPLPLSPPIFSHTQRSWNSSKISLIAIRKFDPVVFPICCPDSDGNQFHNVKFHTKIPIPRFSTTDFSVYRAKCSFSKHPKLFSWIRKLFLSFFNSDKKEEEKTSPSFILERKLVIVEKKKKKTVLSLSSGHERKKRKKAARKGASPPAG